MFRDWCGLDTAATAVLYDDGEDNLALRQLSRTDEPGVILARWILGRAGLARHADALHPGRRARALRHDIFHIAVDESRHLRRRGRQPARGLCLVDDCAARRDDVLHEVRLHDLAAIGEGVSEQCHVHRRDEQGALADGRLRLIALGERAEVGEMRLRHEDLVADLAVKTEAREGFLELLVTHAHAERAEGDVARLRDGLPEVDAAVDFAMALAYRVAAADVAGGCGIPGLR